MSRYEVHLLCDHLCPDGYWNLYPHIADVVGWWPDGSPAWADDTYTGFETDPVRRVVAVVPRRQPEGDDEDAELPITSDVQTVIDLAVTLNDVLWGSGHIADAMAGGGLQAAAQATAARIRATFPGNVAEVLQLAREVAQARATAEHTDGAQ